MEISYPVFPFVKRRRVRADLHARAAPPEKTTRGGMRLKRNLRIGLFVSICLIAVFALLPVTGSGAAQTDFSADYTTVVAGPPASTTTGKMFIRSDRIRSEVTTEDGTLITIIRMDKQLMWTLLPENKYMEIAWKPDPKSPNTPVEEDNYTKVNLGTATVNGYLCDVVQYVPKKKSDGTLTHWITQKFGFPTRVEFKNAKGKVESTTDYTNLKAGRLADSLFEIPEGYTKFSLLGGFGFGKP